MLTKRFLQCQRPSELQLASAGILGTRTTFRLDRTNPIEEMYLIVDVTAAASGPTFASATTPAILDNILGIVKRVQVLVTEGADSNQRPVIDCSGMGLIEFNSKTCVDLDKATWASVALSQGASVPNNQKYRLVYRIPFCHPQVGEPLREYCLLPAHTYPVDPIVNIDWAKDTDYASSGTNTACVAHLLVVRRIMSTAQTAQIQAKGGFIRQDIIETQYSLPTGTSGDQNLKLILGGQYSTLVFRQYLGGSTLTRAVIDQTTTYGSETVWQLRQGTAPLYEWRWKDLQTFAEQSFLGSNGLPYNVFTAASSAGSPTTATAIMPQIEGPASSGNSWTNPASTVLSFLGDGVEQAMELGGLLDADGPLRAGQDLFLYGQIASVATNSSVLYVVGHRFYGNLAPWLGTL